MQLWIEKIGRGQGTSTVRAASTASRWPPDWWAPACRTFACTKRKGLLHPTRSAGGTRLYSVNDVIRLNRIIDLLADGLNLAGVAMVLDLQDDNTRMRNEISKSPHRDENNGGSPETSS